MKTKPARAARVSTEPRRPAAAQPRSGRPTLFASTDFQAAVLIILTIIAYVPVFHAGWLWTDDAYVLQNPTLRSLGGLRDIWFSPHANAVYAPLTFTLYWLEYQGWGPSGAAFHVVGLMLHVANALLLWQLLRRAAVPGAWAAALVFAVHPVNVEAVAWIAQSKMLLSTSLALGALFCWNSLIAADAQQRGLRRLLACLALVVLAVAANPAVYPLVLALPVWAWWRMGSVRGSQWLFAFGCAGIGSIFLFAQLPLHAAAADSAGSLTRLLSGSHALWFYLGKLLWPWPLMVIYPRWAINLNSPLDWLPLAAIGVLFLLLLASRKSLGRGPLAAALMFALLLSPELGFLHTPFFRYADVADHFQYLAAMAPIALIVSAIAAAQIRARRGIANYSTDPAIVRLLPAMVALGISALGGLTLVQLQAYASAEAMWRNNAAHNLVSAYPHEALGAELLRNLHVDEAAESYARALAIDPNLSDAWTGMGQIEHQRHNHMVAIDDYRRALSLDSKNVPARIGLGLVLSMHGDYNASIDLLREAVTLDPESPLAHDTLGVALANFATSMSNMTMLGEAQNEFREALRLRPSYIAAAQHAEGVRDMLRQMANQQTVR